MHRLMMMAGTLILAIFLPNLATAEVLIIPVGTDDDDADLTAQLMELRKKDYRVIDPPSFEGKLGRKLVLPDPSDCQRTTYAAANLTGAKEHLDRLEPDQAKIDVGKALRDIGCEFDVERFGEAYYVLGKVHFFLDDHAAARDAFEKAVLANPSIKLNDKNAPPLLRSLFAEAKGSVIERLNDGQVTTFRFRETAPTYVDLVTEAGIQQLMRTDQTSLDVVGRKVLDDHLRPLGSDVVLVWRDDEVLKQLMFLPLTNGFVTPEVLTLEELKKNGSSPFGVQLAGGYTAFNNPVGHYVGGTFWVKGRLVKSLYLRVGFGMEATSAHNTTFYLPRVDAGVEWIFGDSVARPRVGVLFTAHMQDALLGSPVLPGGMICGGIGFRPPSAPIAPFFEGCGGASVGGPIATIRGGITFWAPNR